MARYPMDLTGAWMRYAMAYSKMSMAAAEVIFRRSMRMSGGAMTAPEAVAMVMEKSSAFVAASEKAAVAAARGADPAGIAAAALGPITAKTRSNVRRLRR